VNVARCRQHRAASSFRPADFRVFSTRIPLNENNELLLAHLRGDIDFEPNLADYHRKAKSTKPKADPKSVFVVAHAGRAERRPEAQA
jgi:hypothetical protein